MSTANNYAPPQSVVADVSPSDVSFELATRLSRLGASLLDGLIFTIPLIPTYYSAFSVMVHARPGTLNYFSVWGAMAGAGVPFYVGLAIELVLIAITTWFVYRNGQTIGKKLVGIKVARPDGSRASLARIFWLRYSITTVIAVVPYVGKLYALVDCCMIFGERRRCCHDYIADTIVIRA